MFHSNCCGNGCTPALIGKILLIVGGINWGLVGVGMLMGSDWNVIHMILGSMATVEAIVYVLVGIVAVMKIFGCRCKKCMLCCKDGTCGAENMGKDM
jgi:uncharacterized membrane protein YuzA (DUF378 family)